MHDYEAVVVRDRVVESRLQIGHGATGWVWQVLP